MLVDSHAHLDDPRFASDLEDVLSRARAAGVERIINVVAGLESSRGALAVARAHADLVSPCVGIHPHEADHADAAARAAIAELSKAPDVVGIGETGLDYHYNLSSHDAQRDAFVWQIELSLERELPLVIHCRDAYDECLAILEPYRGKLRGVAHCFSGDAAAAKAFLGLGLHLSFSGTLAFPKSETLRSVAAQAPVDRLLIETDCPYLAPPPWRGKRNEPAFITATAQRMDHTCGAGSSGRASRNALKLFGLPPKP